MGPAIHFFSSYSGSALACQAMPEEAPTLKVKLARAWKWFGKLLKERASSLNFFNRFFCISLLKYLLTSQMFILTNYCRKDSLD